MRLGSQDGSSPKPQKINHRCSRSCGLFVFNIYVCKVIFFCTLLIHLYLFEYAFVLAYYRFASGLRYPEFVFEDGHFVLVLKIVYSSVCLHTLFFEFVIGIEYTDFVFGLVNSAVHRLTYMY